MANYDSSALFDLYLQIVRSPLHLNTELQVDWVRYEISGPIE
jgi:hypothetical protein